MQIIISVHTTLFPLTSINLRHTPHTRSHMIIGFHMPFPIQNVYFLIHKLNICHIMPLFVTPQLCGLHIAWHQVLSMTKTILFLQIKLKTQRANNYISVHPTWFPLTSINLCHTPHTSMIIGFLTPFPFQKRILSYT